MFPKTGLSFAWGGRVHSVGFPFEVPFAWAEEWGSVRFGVRFPQGLVFPKSLDYIWECSRMLTPEPPLILKLHVAILSI